MIPSKRFERQQLLNICNVELNLQNTNVKKCTAKNDLRYKLDSQNNKKKSEASKSVSCENLPLPKLSVKIGKQSKWRWRQHEMSQWHQRPS